MKLRPVDIFLKAGKNTVLENCIVCMAASLVGTFFYYEYWFETRIQIHKPITWIIAAAIFFIWIKCALISGKDGKISFAIFSFIYWGLPYIYILIYSGRDNVRDYNKWLSMLNRIAKALDLNPFADQAKQFGTSPQVLTAVLLFLIMAAFAGGFFIKRLHNERLDNNDASDYDGEYVMDSDDTENDVQEITSDDDEGGSEDDNVESDERSDKVLDLKDFLNDR